MEFMLNQVECRILGALVEKELTTPDYYPLSLNSLQNACNQKSNRLPVLDLGEGEIIPALERLRHLGLAMESRSGGRVLKYSQTLREKLHLDEMELAVLAELLLRGPQTVGELRGRADRMTSMETLDMVAEVLDELRERDTPLVTRLPRQPGRKESRYAHLLSGPVTDEPVEALSPVFSSAQECQPETGGIRSELDELRQEIASLKEEFEQFKAQFD